MKNSIAFGVAALLALGGCVSHNFEEGQRTNYRCADGKAFSARDVAGSVEIYASGGTQRLAPAGEGSFSNGSVTFVSRGDRATLSGVHNGPYENCRASAAQSWRPNLW